MLLEIAQLPRSTYYYHSKQQNKEDKYAHDKAEITAIYHENKGRYGYRRITDELHNRKIYLNHKTVQRLMKDLGLVCRVRMKKYRSYKGEKGTTADNELNREFRAEKPNQKWVTDVTEFRLFGEKLYLSPILDLYSGDIVTYTLSDSPNLLMVTTMLEQAFQKIPDNTNLLLHSDQGWHYRHKQYVKMLADKGVKQSMSRKGNCYDNSVMENFFGHLKSELLYLQEFESMEHFKLELIEYIDYYNNRRIKARLKGLPPALHRQQALLAA
jgi:transposase InsO family protein